MNFHCPIETSFTVVSVCTNSLIDKARHFAKECAFVFRGVLKTEHDFLGGHCCASDKCCSM